MTPDGFWSQTEETQESDTQPTRAGVISAICGLIEAGVKDDEWAFDETHLSVAERIILRILEKQPATAKGKEEDIRAVVEKLYQENLKEQAVEICSKYAENAALNGYPDFLKDLYDSYDS